MQTVTASSSAPQAKRRKLDHVPEPKLEDTKADAETEQPSKADDADDVDEPEEGPETAIDGAFGDEAGEDQEDASDPFDAHFADPDDNILSRRLECVKKQQWIRKKVELPKVGTAYMSVPKEFTDLPTINRPEHLKLKQKIAGTAAKLRPSFNNVEKALAPLLFNYQDVLYCERNTTNAEDLRQLVCLHAVNHVFK